jgi:Flp pilus assembly protein TadD
MFSKINTSSAIFVIALVTSLVYANSLKNSFVWDDVSVIVENNFVKSWEHLPLIFTKDYLTPFSKTQNLYIPDFTKGSGETTYRPVVTASYFIDYALWQLNPFGYHLTNIILHILNTLLLFCLVSLLTGNRGIALLASLLFAVHPVNSEAVNVISFREDLLAFLFFMSSFILYIKCNGYTGKKQLYTYILSLVSFSLALFSKEMSVTLPFVLVMYDHFFGFHREGKNFLARRASRYAGYIIILAFYLWVRLVVMKNPSEPPVGYPGGSFYTNVITMVQVFFSYIRWLFFPSGIPVVLRESHLSIAHAFFTPEVLVSVSLLMFFLALAIRVRKTATLVSFAVFYLFITLVPVSNIWPIVNFMASRYLYIPMVGFCLAVATLLVTSATHGSRSLQSGILRNAVRCFIIIFLVSSALLTTTRNTVWINNTAVASEMVQRYPQSAMAHASLGASFLKDGVLDKAIREYAVAVRLEPGSALYHKNLGTGYCVKGMLLEASEELAKAYALSCNVPGLDEAYSDLGFAFERKGLYAEAIDAHKRAVALNPGSASRYCALGNAYDKAKDYHAAIHAYKKAIALDSNYFEAYNNMASAYTAIGEIDRAIGLWNAMLQADPNSAIAHFNLAVFYFQQKKYDLAIQHCDQVIALGNQVDPLFLGLLKPHRK